MAGVPADAALAALLRHSRRIAVLGYSTNPLRASHSVSQYLQSVGYAVVGVNPTAAAGVASGAAEVKVVPSLREAHELFAASAGGETPIDIVDVFRNSAALPEVLAEIETLPALPKAVWLQEGVSHPAVEAELAAKGVAVVANRCILKDHDRLLGSNL
jgi:predicted CoA-binding protein